MQDTVPRKDMGKSVRRGRLSLCPGDLDHRVGQVLSQELAHCFVVGDDRDCAAGKQRVVRVKVDRCNDEVIVPVLCFAQDVRRGTPVNIHDINRMTCLPIGCSDLFSAVDRIQYQDIHTKKILEK
jgi:hypothetical protein